MEELAWLVLGSALGGIARFGVSGLVGRLVGETFPWGTMAVNVSGSLAIGFAAAAAATGAGWFGTPEAWRLIATGFLGCYTTVSSFSLQTLALARAGETRLALGNVALSLGVCLSAAAGGLSLGAYLLGSG